MRHDDGSITIRSRIVMADTHYFSIWEITAPVEELKHQKEHLECCEIEDFDFGAKPHYEMNQVMNNNYKLPGLDRMA